MLPVRRVRTRRGKGGAAGARAAARAPAAERREGREAVPGAREEGRERGAHAPAAGGSEGGGGGGAAGAAPQEAEPPGPRSATGRGSEVVEERPAAKRHFPPRCHPGTPLREDTGREPGAGQPPPLPASAPSCEAGRDRSPLPGAQQLPSPSGAVTPPPAPPPPVPRSEPGTCCCRDGDRPGRVGTAEPVGESSAEPGPVRGIAGCCLPAVTALPGRRQDFGLRVGIVPGITARARWSRRAERAPPPAPSLGCSQNVLLQLS